MKLDLKSRNLPIGWLVNREGFMASRGDTGYFYCGRKVMNNHLFCDGYCGPNNGPNCSSCQKLDRQTMPGGRYSGLF